MGKRKWIVLFASLFCATSVFGTDYETDSQNFWVTGQGINSALGSVNRMVCYMKNMRPDALLNDGAYKAIIYKEDCTMGNADASSEESSATATSSQSSSTASSSSSSDAKSKTAQTAIVNVTKEGADLPMIGKVWVSMIAQDQYDFDKKVYIRSEQTASPSADAPYGDFEMSWTIYSNEDKEMPWGEGIVAGMELGRGYLTASGSKVGFLEFSMGGEGNISANFDPDGNVEGVYAEFIYVMPEGGEEAGHSDILVYYEFGMDAATKVYCRNFLSADTMNFDSFDEETGAPVREPYLEEDWSDQVAAAITSEEECFSVDRSTAIRNVYRYGVYNSDGSRVEMSNPGFPIRAEVTLETDEDEDGVLDVVNVFGYADYWGVWIDTINRGLIDGDTVFTKETFGNQEASSTTYRVNPVTVRMQKREKSFVTLNSLDGLSLGLWVGDQEWSEQYGLLGFTDLVTFNEYKGSFDSETCSFTFTQGVSFAEGYTETDLADPVTVTCANWKLHMKRIWDEGEDWAHTQTRGMGVWSQDTNQWYEINHTSMTYPDTLAPVDADGQPIPGDDGSTPLNSGIIVQTETFIPLDADELAGGLNCIGDCPTAATMETTFNAATVLAGVAQNERFNEDGSPIYVPSPFDPAVGSFIKEEVTDQWGNVWEAGQFMDGVLATDVAEYTFTGGNALDSSGTILSLGETFLAYSAGVPNPEMALQGISYQTSQGWTNDVGWGVRSGILVTDAELAGLECRKSGGGLETPSYDDHPSYTGADETALRLCEYNLYGPDGPDTTYQLVFEVRPQYKLTDQDDTLITFGLPKKMYYDIPEDATLYGADAGKRVSLDYQGHGELHGIPGYVLNTATGENIGEFVNEWQDTYRYIPRFTIPDGGALTGKDAEGADVSYKVKALEGEEWLASAEGSIGNLTYSGSVDELLTPTVLRNRGPVNTEMGEYERDPQLGFSINAMPAENDGGTATLTFTVTQGIDATHDSGERRVESSIDLNWVSDGSSYVTVTVPEQTATLTVLDPSGGADGTTFAFDWNFDIAAQDFITLLDGIASPPNVIAIEMLDFLEMNVENTDTIFVFFEQFVQANTETDRVIGSYFLDLSFSDDLDISVLSEVVVALVKDGEPELSSLLTDYIGPEPTELLNNGDPSVVHGEIIYDPTP